MEKHTAIDGKKPETLEKSVGFSDAEKQKVRTFDTPTLASKLGALQAIQKENTSALEAKIKVLVARQQKSERPHTGSGKIVTIGDTPIDITLLDDATKHEVVEYEQVSHERNVKIKFLEKRQDYRYLEASIAQKPRFVETEQTIHSSEGLEEIIARGDEFIALDQDIVFDEDQVPTSLIEEQVRIEHEKLIDSDSWRSIVQAHEGDETRSEETAKAGLRAYVRMSVINYYVGDQAIAKKLGMGDVLKAFQDVKKHVIVAIKQKIQEREIEKNEFKQSVVADEMHAAIQEGRIDTSVVTLLEHGETSFLFSSLDDFSRLPEERHHEIYQQLCRLQGKEIDTTLEGGSLKDAVMEGLKTIQTMFSERLSSIAWEQGLLGSTVHLQGLFSGRLVGEKPLYEDVGFGFDTMKITDAQGSIENTITFQGTLMTYTIAPDGTVILYNDIGEESSRIAGLSPATVTQMIEEQTVDMHDILSCGTREAVEADFSQRWADTITKHIQSQMTSIAVSREKTFDAVQVQTFGSHLHGVLETDKKRGHTMTLEKEMERELFIDLIYKKNTVQGVGFSKANKVLCSDAFQKFIRQLPSSVSIWEFLHDAGLVGSDSVALESGGPFFGLGRTRLGALVGSVAETESIQFNDLADFVETGENNTLFTQKYGKFFGVGG